MQRNLAPVAKSREEEIAGDPIRAVEHGGAPMPEDVRDFFGMRFGHDFGRVRVHDDQNAANAAEAIHARAYTVGSHIAFAPGQYSPSTTQGRKLLAHELVHVVQQAGMAGTRCPSQPNQRSTADVFANSAGIVQRQGDDSDSPRRHRRAFNPPEGRWILVSLQEVGDSAGRTGLVRIYDGTTLRHSFRASGGRPGHTTPIGEFRIDFRDVDHRSSEYGHCVPADGARRRVTSGSGDCRAGERYEGADMAFFQRFAPLVGFHRGDPDEASHGCIHLEGSDARTLWSAVRPRTTVIVCAGAGCRWYTRGILAERRAEASERTGSRRRRD